MEIGLVQKINIDNEMQQAYLDYAMSVIVARALPDARDGLKPVHRRILYAMYDMGLKPDSNYKKSARIVGEVLGKYHPHGDMAVYEAMARMAQDFSMRYLLVDGQGNFGSVDGDPPAAMRYTEARIADAAVDMLSDIQKDTVNYLDNFDGTLTEPVVLPSAIPNLLVNGATGIAVGMSTSIPPHNLGEVVDALIYILNRWEKMDDITLDELMQFVQGPDFPTGGIIIQSADGDGLHSAYGTGRGKVTIQARAHIEEMERGRSRIIVTELPYMTNKSALIERIASLVRDERLDGIADLRDESDRQGMRIVIELNKAADPEKVLFELYKSTPMQSTFSIIVLALVDGEPRMLGLKQALRVYVEHRLEIIRRRSEYDLARARQRAHILEGLLVALRNLDEVINLIRHSKDADTAKLGLIKKFKLSEVQALAILDMPLRRLASLERKKLEDEYKELLAQIKELEGLLKSPKRMRQVVSDELLAVKERHGDRRRTQIVILKEGESTRAVLTATDLAPEKAVWVAVTAEGLISRTMDNKPPRTSGRDAPILLANCNTRHTLYLVTNQGEATAIAMQAIPETEKPGEGIPFFRISALKEKDTLTAILSLPTKSERNEENYLLTVSRLGMVKKSSLVELPGPSAHSFTLVKVNEDDTLGWARVTTGKNDLLLLTRQGMAIRFSEEEVRPMGLVAAGVLGIKLANGDVLCGMEILPQPGEILIAASDGSAKRIAPDQFPRQGRYGQGVSAWKLPARVYAVGMVLGKGNERVTLHLAKQASKSIRLDDAPLVGRAARGKTVIELKADDEVLYLTRSQEDSGGPAPKPPRKPSTSDGSITNKRSGAQIPTSQKEARPKKEAAPKQAAKPTTTASAKTPPKPASKTRPAATSPSAARSTTGKLATTKGTTEKQKTGKQSTATQLALLSVPEAKKTSKPVRGEKKAPVRHTPAKPVSPKVTATRQTTTKQTPAKQPPVKPAPARRTPTKPAPAKPAPSKSSGKSPTRKTPPPK
jgi:DNA gyrase subunit A